jgi:hypothetical protein
MRPQSSFIGMLPPPPPPSPPPPTFSSAARTPTTDEITRQQHVINMIVEALELVAEIDEEFLWLSDDHDHDHEPL